MCEFYHPIAVNKTTVLSDQQCCQRWYDGFHISAYPILTRLIQHSYHNSTAMKRTASQIKCRAHYVPPNILKCEVNLFGFKKNSVTI